MQIGIVAMMGKVTLLGLFSAALWSNKFQKTLILAFEAIVQQTFVTALFFYFWSSVWMGTKCDSLAVKLLPPRASSRFGRGSARSIL